jgi:hypothetical protein
MTPDEYIEFMNKIEVGCTVSLYCNYNDINFLEWDEYEDVIVTEIKDCDHSLECDDMNDTCYYCIGQIGVNGEKPSCLGYSTWMSEDKIEFAAFNCRKIEFIEEKDFEI